MMREALAGAIAMHWPKAEVVCVADFASAQVAAASHQPEVILCDLGMPGALPLIGVGEVRAAAPAARLIVVTALEDDGLLLDLFNLGIAGFVPKASSGAILEAAIRLVLAGGTYLPPRVIALTGTNALEGPPPIRAATLSLTQRQIQVLQKVASGASNKVIARELGVSPATVKAHLAALMAVLGATNRMEATTKGRSMGLIA